MIEMYKQFDYCKHLLMVYIIEVHVNFYAKLGAAVGFDSLSSINFSYETLGCESLPLSSVHSIGDKVLRFFHVACKEESSRNRVHLIGNRRLRYGHASIEVHQVYLISTVITLQIHG